MPALHTINGIRKSAPGTTDLLGQRLESQYRYEWHKITVPVSHVWTSWTRGSAIRIARKHIIPHVIPGSNVAAHSQGCLLTWAAMYVWHHEMGHTEPLFYRILMMGPAMNRGGWRWESLGFDALRVIHNPFDIAIRAGSWVPGHVFGRAGAQGFSTKDPRIENIPKTSFTGPFNHNAPYFREPYLSRTANKADAFFNTAFPSGGA